MTDNTELAEKTGELVAVLIQFLLAVTVIWSVTSFIFALPYTWLEVFGAGLLFNMFKNSIARAFKHGHD